MPISLPFLTYEPNTQIPDPKKLRLSYLILSYLILNISNVWTRSTENMKKGIEDIMMEGGGGCFEIKWND
jgi:hypothetical protein